MNKSPYELRSSNRILTHVGDRDVMKLYIVTMWGDDSDPEGPDARHNTAVLVRAQDLESAVACAETLFRSLPLKRLVPEADHVKEIGIATSSSEEACVLLGPSMESQFKPHHGYETFWQKDFCEEGEWTFMNREGPL